MKVGIKLFVYELEISSINPPGEINSIFNGRLISISFVFVNDWELVLSVK